MFVCVCVCVADNGVTVSMNDIVMKLVAATLKVIRYLYSTFSMWTHWTKCSQYHMCSPCMCACIYVCEREGVKVYMCLCGKECVSPAVVCEDKLGACVCVFVCVHVFVCTALFWSGGILCISHSHSPTGDA